MADAEPSGSESLLPIYLNDHRAAATAGLSLAKRSAKSNTETGFAQVLRGLAADLEADVRSLDDVFRALDVPKSRVKAGLAMAGELVGRLKMNGRIRQYSPLSRVLEMEGLEGTIGSNRRVWTTLAQLQADEQRLSSFDFAALQQRADDQLQRVQRLHQDAVEVAFRDQPEEDQVVLPGGVDPSPTRPPGDSPWVGDHEGEAAAPAGGPGVTPVGTKKGNADTSVFEGDSERPVDGVATEAELQSADEDTFPPSV